VLVLRNRPLLPSRPQQSGVLVIPEPHPDAQKIRVLFVPAFLGSGPVDEEILLLARALPRERYRITVAA